MHQYQENGQVKTDLYCHDCNKHFIARIDYDIDGQHVIECPHCGHEHCRVIKDGIVTGDRWEGRNGVRRIDVEKRNVWKSDDRVLTTTTTSHFLRERWLNRLGN